MAILLMNSCVYRAVKSLFFIFVIILIPIKCKNSCGDNNNTATNWGYQGINGVTNWGNMFKTCDTNVIAKNQSPIDIPKGLKSAKSSLELGYNISNLSMIYNGHTIQIIPETTNTLVYNSIKYNLKQINFHTPSEHKVKGKSYAGEIHFVHADEKDNLLILGVFLKVSKKSKNPVLEKVLSDLPIKQDIKKSIEQVDLNKLFTKNLKRYEYAGSLTNPPCSEGVSWIILKTPIKASKVAINNITKIVGDNARPVQDINVRKVVKSK